MTAKELVELFTLILKLTSLRVEIQEGLEAKGSQVSPRAQLH